MQNAKVKDINELFSLYLKDTMPNYPIQDTDTYDCKPDNIDVEISHYVNYNGDFYVTVSTSYDTLDENVIYQDAIPISDLLVWIYNSKNNQKGA